MRKRFLAFIEKHALILPQERVLLAVSGGLDSMVMLHLFHQSDIPIAVAHCNFCLRGSASDADEALVKDQAKGLGIAFFNKRFDTKAYAAEKGISTQMAARDLRYAWFEALCREEGYQKLATAHHLNDSLETVIHNLARGTSISGLRGIAVMRGEVIRPLIDFTREELHAWAAGHGVVWREDASNQETYYKRNFIRQKVVPPLREVNEDLFTTFKTTLARNREVESVFLAHVETVRSRAVEKRGDDWYILKSAVSGPYVLELLLKPFGFGYGQSVGVWSEINGLSGNRFDSKSHQCLVDREYLIVSELGRGKTDQTAELGDEEREVQIAGKRYEVRQMAAAELEEGLKKERNALLDLDKLSFPLRIRAWQEGDVFCPLGMKGKKKLSDFMIDRKIPVNLKSRVSVVESAGEIVWVVGMRIDNRFKVTKDSKRLLCLIEKE